MKKTILLLLLFFAMIAIHAQEKGFHITFDGGVGKTILEYDLNGGTSGGNVGYGGSVGVQYFFTPHWGLSLSANLFAFNTHSFYQDKAFLYRDQVDDEGDRYDLTLQLLDWREKQSTLFLEIPLMGLFQTKFGVRERFGLYFGLGFKVQIPINSTFERGAGDVHVAGYYPDLGVGFGKDWSVDLPHHGYGIHGERLWSGKNNLKTGLAIVGEFGFLVGLTARTDMRISVSADYGLLNIYRGSEVLLAPVNGVTQQDGSYIAEHVTYAGTLNSDLTSKVNTLSIRGNLGFRIKLGKLREDNPLRRDTVREYERIYERVTTGTGGDTIIINPVIIQVPVPVEGPGRNNNVINGGGGGPNREIVIVQTPNEGVNNGRKGTTGRGHNYPMDVAETFEESVYFDLNKYTLDREAMAVLDRKVDLMKRHPNASLSLVGHTCDLGQETQNFQLSFKRAEEARNYMIRRGINPSRITIVPMGERYPTYPNTSESNRRLNRRVDFMISE